jgi:hypothetical protein
MHSLTQLENVFCLEAKMGMIHRWEEAEPPEEEEP